MPRRPRALLVDDDPFVLEILSALLDRCGIDTVRADDGRSGLRVLSEELLSLDLLVTDLVMPNLSGDALLMAVRELGGERDLPILVTSACVDADLAQALRVAGADAVVDKRNGLEPVAAAAWSLLAARGLVDAEPRSGAHQLASPEAVAEAQPVPLFRIGLARRE